MLKTTRTLLPDQMTSPTKQSRHQIQSYVGQATLVKPAPGIRTFLLASIFR
jgi:hypothetical protein